jgi:anti-anti-sigma factor
MSGVSWLISRAGPFVRRNDAMRNPLYAVAAAPANRGDVNVTVSGEIDLAAHGELRTTLLQAVNASRRKVVVDLHQAKFLDSGGIGVLLQALQAARESSRELTVVGAGGMVRQILEIAGVYAILAGEEAESGPDGPGRRV